MSLVRRVWQAIETMSMARLARMTQDSDPVRGMARALDLWDEVIRLSWPAGSEFPAHLTERVAAMVQADPPRRLGPGSIASAGPATSWPRGPEIVAARRS